MAGAKLLRWIPTASPELAELLDNASGPLQEPVRSEIFGLQRFAQHGRSLGQTHRAAPARLSQATFFPRLRNNIDTLGQAHRYIGGQAVAGYDISPAAEWLLDNFHLIEAQLKEIHDGMPRRYFRALPVLQDEPLAGLPRIYGVAWAFVAHTDSAFDEDLMVHFLCAYQETRELTLGEIWALPTTLRVVLIENLRRLAERVAAHQAAREVANLCCDQIQTWSVPSLDTLLGLMQGRGVGPVFLAQVAQRLHDRGTLAHMHQSPEQGAWLHQALPNPAHTQAQQSADQTADNLSVSNAVTSLRAIGDADWPDIVARSSTLMRMMLTSPVFEAEGVSTRDETLHDIERLARQGRRSEVSVVQALLALMQVQQAPPHLPLDTVASECLASHWLRGPGRAKLMQALGMRERLAIVGRMAARHLAMPAYLIALLAGTLCLAAWLLLQHGAPLPLNTAPWLMWLGAVLLLFPASEAVIAVINRLVSESARPHHLPRLVLQNGIPAAHRVLVVIPAMLTDAASTRQLAHRLLLHYLANAEPQAQFALLTDWVDADTPRVAADAALLDGAIQQIRQLNARYPVSAEDALLAGPAARFIVLHRERKFSVSEQRWIGWERKRGKLEQLVAALAQKSSTAFIDLGHDSALASNLRYIVTLDSDTQMPPGRLRELVGVAAHPHNQPTLAPDGRSVVSGYGILQPRIVTPLPAIKELTPYHWLFSGQCGIDPYSAASSEVYQDLFHEGTFTGKGLLNVQAMHAVLTGRLPEGQVLSHDLFEGSLARCAAVSDITFVEEAPFHADVAASRVHRWTRGDWQLLPLLLAPKRYRVAPINRWKMFDNLRRSLVAPASMALLLLTLAGAALSPWAALLLVFAAFSAGPLMGALAGFSPRRDDLAQRHFYQLALIELARGLCAGLWPLLQLLQQSMAALDAIVRSLYRTFVSRRKLLQWTTAQAAKVAQAQTAGAFKDMLRRHWKEPIAAMAVLGLLLLVGTPWLALTLCLCLLWAASPLWTWWVSSHHQLRQSVALSAQERTYLEALAHDTWRLFERCVTVADNHLPPDNLQTLPNEVLAHRTSPTNIGLYLLSVACAKAFGWIDTTELLARMEATLATLLSLPRHRGHFLNWYDTQTCAPLLPMYVSSVDSGNLSGHLLAVGQACTALAHDAPTRLETQRLRALAEAFEQLAWQADFSFLYHRKRHLFHIGYRVAEQQLDSGLYDLLASESRLTSLLAIAKGDVPVRHWASLGRPFYAIGADTGLRSWSGSMFEYFMPSLVLDEPHGSVLHGACHAALREQMAYARQSGVPWGISESAYAGRDHTLAYQYAPQGVPRLALRRTPQHELVIAPYATALAGQIAPHSACLNFVALEALQARGRYGFIEALDFSPARQAGTDVYTKVGTFMGHHQAMSLVAIANVLLDGVARRWGMGNARIEAVASLLHERAPREVSALAAPPPFTTSLVPERSSPGLLREVMPGTLPIEPTHLLSNGRYKVALRANGAGWSRWGQTDITRWRDDALRDACGHFMHVRWQRDEPDGEADTARNASLVSLTQHPAPDPAATYRSSFHADRVCFDAAWPELVARTTVWVSPEDDIEFRQVELTNLSDQILDIELFSAFEVTLSSPESDEAHPAFANLFVSAQWLAEHQALVFERKPRLQTEQSMRAAHFLAETDPQVLGVRLQTDRQKWAGRNQAASQPQAQVDDIPAEPNPLEPMRPSVLDTGLDPVSVLAVRLRMAPQSKAQLTFATAASDDAATLHAVIDKYRQRGHVQRAALMSSTLAGIRLRTLAITAENFAAIQFMTTALVLCLSRPQAIAAHTDSTEVCDRRLLWRFGISGDRPIILVSTAVAQGLGLLRSLGQALQLWSWGGMACDVVVVNAEPASYIMVLQHEINAIRERHIADGSAVHGPLATGFHLLRADEISADELSTLQALARIRLHADGRPLAHHVQAWLARHEQDMQERQDTACTPLIAAPAPATAVPAPQGVFAMPSGDFQFDVHARLRPIRPWINVLANEQFGAHLSESGGGYTWAANSRMNQLTAWSNDPVCDPPSEWFVLQDTKTMDVWSLAPSAWGDPSVSYRVVHGQGHSSISHRRGDLDVVASWCVDEHAAVKQVRIQLINRGHRTQHLRIIGMAEWMMGARRADRSTVHTSVHTQRLPSAPQTGLMFDAQRERILTTLLATQRERGTGFGQGTAFLALAGSSADAHDWTCDRRECFDASGHPIVPDHLGRRSGAGLDPCAALSTNVDLVAGDKAERVFLLGYADSPNAARQLAAVSAVLPAQERQERARRAWNELLGATIVKTPDPLFDVMVNRWLLYQTVSCRLWAKSGFYQAGGATGFRDQLQDAMSLVWAAPGMLRQQILLCASRQFVQGDVQHWWHAPGGAGVRTRMSDDLLWLPHACVHHVRATGDMTLLDQSVSFLEGDAIPEHAEDAYFAPSSSEQSATVYEHAARAIDLSLRVGAHGLPLMGTGDWNDGMNRVGAQGRGESVWLGWFLCRLVLDFAPLARARGDAQRADAWEAAAQGWQAALLGPAWDGQWFKRAFFDDGQPLGSHTNEEARIDLIAQAWSVLSNVAPLHMQKTAMQAVEANLVDHEAGLIRLLTPPLVHAQPSAGYIQAYPPGVRENGGQYAHAGVWALMAQAKLAPSRPDNTLAHDLPYRYFTDLSPAHRAQDAHQGPVYGLEPYVMAADIYSAPPYVGRGGWSWYTGSAAWMHRGAIESILGLQLGATELFFEPCLPSHWPHAQLTLCRDGRTMRFILLRAQPHLALETALSLALSSPQDAATLLLPGQRLLWATLPSQSCFVIALLAVPTLPAPAHPLVPQAL